MGIRSFVGRDGCRYGWVTLYCWQQVETCMMHICISWFQTSFVSVQNIVGCFADWMRVFVVLVHLPLGTFWIYNKPSFSTHYHVETPLGYYYPWLKTKEKWSKVQPLPSWLCVGLWIECVWRCSMVWRVFFWKVQNLIYWVSRFQKMKLLLVGGY